MRKLLYTDGKHKPNRNSCNPTATRNVKEKTLCFFFTFHFIFILSFSLTFVIITGDEVSLNSLCIASCDRLVRDEWNQSASKWCEKLQHENMIKCSCSKGNGNTSERDRVKDRPCRFTHCYLSWLADKLARLLARLLAGSLRLRALGSRTSAGQFMLHFHNMWCFVVAALALNVGLLQLRSKRWIIIFTSTNTKRYTLA